jgi:hypothetical protein
VADLIDHGVVVSDAPPDHIRFVIHRHVRIPDVEHAAPRIREAAAGLAAGRQGSVD